MTVEVALLVSIVSVCFSIFFGLKSSKHTDIKEIENRVAENTWVNVKLDEISRNTSEIKEEIRLQKKEVQSLAERMAGVEASSKQAHKRIDDMVNHHGREEKE